MRGCANVCEYMKENVKVCEVFKDVQKYARACEDV